MSPSYEAAYPRFGGSAETASVEDRASFIVKTYLHLFGAILAFIGLEIFLLNQPGIEKLALKMITGYNWLVVLGLFMVSGWVADKLAHSEAAPAVQYLGLAVAVIGWAVVFVPILLIASFYYDGVIASAGIITMGVFTGMTGIVFVTRKNFSFLGPVLGIATIAAFCLIVCAILFGFNLGMVFCVALVVLACGYILYDTSNVLHVYRTDQHVAASLALFSSIALLFWYVLRIVIMLTGRE